MSAYTVVPVPAHECPRSAARVIMSPGDVWRCGCGRSWTWTGDGVWQPVPEPEPAPVHGEYQPPSELAHRIRNLLRGEHERCRNPGCALTFIWAEDVQAILDARDRLGEVCTCRPRESGEAPEVPDRDCPAHGEQAW